MRQSKLKTSSYVLASLLCVSLLTGCVRGVFNTCPPVVVYTHEQQKKAATELGQLETDSTVLDMMLDYAKLREQLGYCISD